MAGQDVPANVAATGDEQPSACAHVRLSSSVREREEEGARGEEREKSVNPKAENSIRPSQSCILVLQCQTAL